MNLNGLSRASAALAICLSAMLLVAVENKAHAAPVRYSFTAGPSLGGAFSEFMGSSISGTFTYDAAEIQTFTTGVADNPANAALYGAHFVLGVLSGSYSAMNATVSGGGLLSNFTFSDTFGTTVVSNEGFRDTVTGQREDLLSLDADPFGAGGIHSIVPFSFGGFRLWNMRMFWIENQTNPDLVPDLLSDQNLPGVLPSIQGRLFLDFVPIGNTTGTPLSFIFFDHLMVAPVSQLPEPAPFALMLAGFALLGIGVCRRKPCIPIKTVDELVGSTQSG
jgi:hypothetical protein